MTSRFLRNYRPLVQGLCAASRHNVQTTGRHRVDVPAQGPNGQSVPSSAPSSLQVFQKFSLHTASVHRPCHDAPYFLDGVKV